MGRARLPLKLIPKERARKLSFMQRKKVLMKKMSEFSTMFEVEACLIVYDSNKDAQPMTWPQDLTKVHAIIEKYEREKNENPPEMFGLEDYFENKKNEVEAEISKVRKEILKIKYPTWDPSFNNLREKQLGDFIAMLNTKMETCKQRITMLKNKQQNEANISFIQNTAQLESAAPNPSQPSLMQNISQAPMKPLDDNNQLASYLHKHDKGSQSQMPYFDPNLMQLMAKNNNGMVDSTNQVDVPLDCTKQTDAVVDSTNQLGEPDWASLLSEPIDWASELGVPEDWASNLGEPKDWTSKFGELVDWDSQTGELENWASQLGTARLESSTDQVQSNSNFSSLCAETQEKCFACKKTVNPTEKVAIDGTSYHKACFKCTHGGCVISPSNYVAHEHRLYCRHHHTQLFKQEGNVNLTSKKMSIG